MNSMFIFILAICMVASTIGVVARNDHQDQRIAALEAQVAELRK